MIGFASVGGIPKRAYRVRRRVVDRCPVQCANGSGNLGAGPSCCGGSAVSLTPFWRTRRQAQALPHRRDARGHWTIDAELRLAKYWPRHRRPLRRARPRAISPLAQTLEAESCVVVVYRSGSLASVRSSDVKEEC